MLERFVVVISSMPLVERCCLNKVPPVSTFCATGKLRVLETGDGKTSMRYSGSEMDMFLRKKSIDFRSNAAVQNFIETVEYSVGI